MSDLTRQLHRLGDRTPPIRWSAPYLRARAEQKRRLRRLVGGAIISLVTVMVVIGSSLLVGHARSPQPVHPAVQPSLGTSALDPSTYELLIARDNNVVLILEDSVSGDRPTWRLELALQSAIVGQKDRCPTSPGGCIPKQTEPETALYGLTPDATLTAEDLHAFEVLSQPMSTQTATWMRTTEPNLLIPKLTHCGPDPADYAGAELQVASYVAPGLFTPGYMNEFVIRFETVDAATKAFAGIRDRAAQCLPDSGYGPAVAYIDESTFPVPGWPVDDAYGAAFFRE